MGWQIIGQRVALLTASGKTVFPTADDIHALNSGCTPRDDVYADLPAPAAVLPLTFSGLGANLQAATRAEGSAIILELLAVYRSQSVMLSMDEEGLPDSVIIDGRWLDLLNAHASLSECLQEAGITATGTITLRQYVSFRRAAATHGSFELRDTVDLQPGSHVWETAGQSPLLAARLYGYQQHGWRWMDFMGQEQCGCILGDEMGLGKTLQVIALICARRGPADTPALVVAPVSLLENWRRELARFAPGLAVHLHHGPSRAGSHVRLMGYDVVITSYAVAASDRALFRMAYWDLLVMDEAQHIKNPDAERTRALRGIPCRMAVAVSGTPFENHLSDIWSIMEFVMPGYLGTHAQFRREFPDDAGGAARLGPFISPFLLRRRVADVAAELPERTDIPVMLTMSDEEAGHYERVRSALAEQYLAGSEQPQGLAVLQKLRQCCAHPGLLTQELLQPHPEVHSVKYAHLCTLLAEAFAHAEKVILFTSFLRMSALLCHDIRERFDVPVTEINGSTAIDMRQPIIDRFSETVGPALLVLNPRAAGTGLNITAARLVIHYNPEWNPALEDQASARAWRLGQSKKVFIYRLYCRETVEEVISECLEKKRIMAASAVVGTDGSAMSREDLLRALTMSPAGVAA